ncbi:MAG: RadC family protein [Hominilimicola sp.]
MADKKNNHLHHRQRMREEFAQTGFKGWPKHKVLEYLMYYTIPVADTNDMAHDLIRKSGGFTNVFHASKEELKDVDGVGEKTAGYLRMLGEFVKYYNNVIYDKDTFVLDSNTSEQYFRDLFAGHSRECFFIICLDPQNHILNSERISEGSFESMDIDVSRIMRIAVKCNAASVVMAHNHPSGIAKASQADIVSTQAVERALLMGGISLLDHIIFADGKCVSMRNEKLLLGALSGGIIKEK